MFQATRITFDSNTENSLRDIIEVNCLVNPNFVVFAFESIITYKFGEMHTVTCLLNNGTSIDLLDEDKNLLKYILSKFILGTN